MRIKAIDSHAHLHFKNFDADRDDVIHRAKQAGIIAIIDIAISSRDFLVAKTKLKSYISEGYVFLTLGFAPQLIEELDVNTFIEFAKKNSESYIAIGECGLDYYWITREELIEKMEHAFIEILELTHSLKKPLIIHARTAHRKNAYMRIVEFLKQYNISKAIFHSFLGSLRDLKAILDGGWYVGIPTVYIRRKDLTPIIRELDINYILVETDAPYLSPYKGARNEPANIIKLIEYLSKIKGIEIEDLARAVIRNTIRFFDLDLRLD